MSDGEGICSMQIMSVKQIADYCNCSESAIRIYIDRYCWQRIRMHDKTKAVLYEVNEDELDSLRLLIIARLKKKKRKRNVNTEAN